MKFTIAISALLSLYASICGAAGTHAIAMHGSPKYLPDFDHFDYVNPHAPKGGTLKLASVGTFDSFNPYIPKGNSGVGASVETLLKTSADEPFSAYGLIAESVEVPTDRSWAKFKIRRSARWHDGVPITVEDVIWSLNTLKEKGHPFYRFYYSGVSSARKVDKDVVLFEFSDKSNRELPLIVGQMPILPKHYWENRDFTKTTLEPPLNSGPYKIKTFEPGRFVILERVDNYWGNSLPVNVGQNNFDEIRVDYYRDETVVREAIKSGDIDYREENQAKAWALDYDTPAVTSGLLRKVNIRHHNPTGMQAFVYNTRRPVFENVLVREALSYAFDFEWTNKNLFFGQYTRTNSFFSNSDLASNDLPSEREIAILTPFRDQLPSKLFQTAFKSPVTDGEGWPRANLEKSRTLLQQAGWTVRDMRLTNTVTGEPFIFEILLYSEGFERIVLPFVRNLSKLGIQANVRRVDQSQYVNRIRSFDFDMIVSGWGSSESPGNEQRGQWSSSAADSPAASNYAGVKNPIIDALIEGLIRAKTREDLVAHTRALDRVLLHGHYVIPQWHLRSQRILYWDKFSMPTITPKSGTSTTYWWFDDEKSQALENNRISSASKDDGDSDSFNSTTLLIGLALLTALIWIRRWRRQV